jgi:cytoskeletal protein CcmA (bactofilin family)
MLGLLLFSSAVYADKTFPGDLPPGCSGSGSAYSCGSLTISEHYFFTGSGNVTVTVNGTLTINDYTIGQWNDNANVTFVVNGNVTINSPTIHANINAGSNNITYNGVASTSGNLITTTGNISTRGAVYGNITTNSGTITVNANSTSVIWGEITVKNATSSNYLRINQDAVVNGSIYTNSTSTTANLYVEIAERATINGSIIALGRDYTYVDLNFDSVVNGDITAFGDDASRVRLNDRARINGSVKSTSVDVDDGDVDLNANARITGNITAFGDIDNSGQINGCAHSTYTAGGDIRLRSGSSNSGGSCCGSNRTSCNSSCVSNSSSFATTLCQSAEAIVVNAYGQSVNGVWPIMELWVNEVKVDSVIVNSGSAQNYTFYANLPATNSFKLDLVFPNDAWNPPEDRNLFINSINFKSKTILSTDPSVTRDYGDNASTYFDGVSTQGPGAEMYSNGAMRFNTSELVAYYALDETSWNGTNNETKDTAGFTGGPFDGQGFGSVKPTAMSSSPARSSGVAGTCGYATFSGEANQSSFTLDGLPVSTTAGAKTTVSFWMYWDGNTYYSTPIGWNLYALSIGNGVFGFDTFNGDRYGVNSSVLAVGWRHIVAVFNNGNVNQTQLYIDGVKQTLSQVRGVPNNGNAIVQSTLNLARISNGINTRGFRNGSIDEVKVYNGEVTQAQVTADFNATHACPQATLIAKYHLDEQSWDGTTNETKDTAGFIGGPFDGQAIGTPKPTATSNNPTPRNTCGYASFTGSSNGSAFILDNLPVSTANGAKTSVSFWMFWDGANVVKIPIGWNRYDLVVDGTLAFDTWNADRFGVSSNGLANRWVHIVAVFTNGNVSQNELYIDGVKQTLSQMYASPNNANAVVQSTLKVGGVTFDNNYGFNGGRIDEVKVYNGAVTQAQVTADYNATHLCPSYATNATPNRFNCVAEQETNVNTGKLYTQLVATNFNIKVAALKADGTAETNFSAASDRTAILRFRNQVSNALIPFNGGETANSKNVLFTTANNTGIVTITGINIPQVYRDLRCEVSEGAISGAPSTDNFSVRPQALFFNTSSANGDPTNGANADTNNPIKAGANFTLDVRATAAGVAAAVGYDGTPVLASNINSTRITPHTDGMSGILAGSFSQANSSTAIATGNFTYSEVGYFIIQNDGVIDDSFTLVDQASGDCVVGSAVKAVDVNGKIGCNVRLWTSTPYIGRFIPHHLDITSSMSTNACGAFNYYGQDGVSTTFVLSAQNSGNAVTQNYTGAFAKLPLNAWSSTTGFRFAATGLTSGTLSSGALAPTGSWANGVTTVTAMHQVARLATPMNPATISITAQPIDSDGVTMPIATLDSNIPFRYGRLKLSNAYGSELLPLTIPIEAQYWDGTTYRRNTLDSCTNTTAANMTLSNYKKNLNAGETTLSGGGLMNEGKSSFTLSKPGAGNSGTVDLTFSLTNFPWMGTAPTDNLTARATFGLYKSPIIYMRENY